MAKRIITYGTFDMFHIGHLNLFKRLSELADELIVGVSTDEFNESKGKSSFIQYAHRAEIVRSIKYVDLVIPETNWAQKTADIKKYNCDIFAIGNDWKGKFDFLKEHCEVIYLDRTQGVSTTQLKESLNGFLSGTSTDNKEAIEILKKLNDELN